MNIEELLKAEPWRSGHGHPRNALSAGWVGEERTQCDGEIEWEGSTTYWWCKKCGYVGSSTYTMHRRVQFPAEFLQNSILFFLQKRLDAGMTLEQAMLQMNYVTAIALRNAAALPPSELGRYVTQLLVP